MVCDQKNKSVENRLVLSGIAWQSYVPLGQVVAGASKRHNAVRTLSIVFPGTGR